MSDTSRHAHHPHFADLIDDQGSWKYTNALIDSASPYLQQHAHNPVHWLPWSEQAFTRARELNRPIFLSVGYSTCYWCHVMERLVFENPQIASQMNEQFVNIKVDREERPDIDEIYMASVQVFTLQTTGQARGGWPMSVFLTPPGAGEEDDPGLKPILGGTYFPPTEQHGMPSFPQVMQAVSQAWQDRRDEVLQQADSVTNATRKWLNRTSGEAAQSIDPTWPDQAADTLMRSYDTQHAGFGGAPKFPQPCVLSFMYDHGQANNDPQQTTAVHQTLLALAEGGIYDQVGGGFHRYSTDAHWLVPHFEKMLYDNGQLVELYARAHQHQPPKDDPKLYERVIRQTCDYILREMVDETGLFYSAQDAEVNSHEGENYLWLPEEIDAALNDDALAERAREMYGLNGQPNFRDPHDPDAQPRYVLHLPKSLAALADQWGMTIDEVAQLRQRMNKALLAARDNRPQPSTDDKTITSWNGMMIAGLAVAGRAIRDDRLIHAATQAAISVLEKLVDPQAKQGSGLLHSKRAGKPGPDAFLEDYAFLIHGLIELYRSTDHQPWLDQAIKLADEAGDKFDAFLSFGGGYFETRADQLDLITRVRSHSDGVIPSANSQMAHNLIDLYELTQDERWLTHVKRDVKSFAGQLSEHPAAMPHLLAAMLRLNQIAPDWQQQSAAQRQRPDDELIDWEVTYNRRIDGAWQVIMHLLIHPAYHLYAPGNSKDKVRQVSLELEHHEGMHLEPHFPAGETWLPGPDIEPIAIYRGRVQIPMLVNGAQPGDKIKLRFRYQACTEDACLPEHEKEIQLVLAEA